ncbi:hypothetical protein BZM26_34960 [Paraburkholderia strydomiana]|nr:hypothetical protein BZM26_34960 [Paraburkholderia strydomiana]
MQCSSAGWPSAHETGDAALRRIADWLRDHGRLDSDIAARYCGEEFTVALADTDAAHTAKAAEATQAEYVVCASQPSGTRSICVRARGGRAVCASQQRTDVGLSVRFGLDLG